MIPPDFATFWSQAAQQGFKPKIATIGKALLFPSAVSALGDRGDGLSSEIWWSPSHPFKSSLTGQTAKQLCEAYTAAMGKPWTQPIGFKYGLFEVAIDALKRAKSPKDPKAILEAIVATNLNTIVGPISWGRGPVKNVSKTPLVGGQWTKTAGGLRPRDLRECDRAGDSGRRQAARLELMPRQPLGNNRACCHCERSEAIHLATRHLPEEFAEPVV